MNAQMTPEVKAAVMQLMGQTYGQIKKQDDMLVGKSANLQPKSTEMKNMVESLLNTPASQPSPPQPVPQPVPQPAPQPVPTTITPEQAIAELQTVDPQVQEVYQAEQLEFNLTAPDKIDQLISAVKESNLLLKDIKLQLENSNVRPKRKAAKSKVAD